MVITKRRTFINNLMYITHLIKQIYLLIMYLNPSHFGISQDNIHHAPQGAYIKRKQHKEYKSLKLQM